MAHFEQAEKEYLQMVKLIKELCILKRGKLDQEEYKKVLTQFDTSIQGVLLYVGLLNGYLDEAERLFITRITIYGDLMTKINITGKMRLFRQWQPLTWDNINETTVDHQRLIEIIKETVTFELSDFVTVLVVIDRDISSKSYIDEISKLVPGLITAICVVGENIAEEDNKLKAIEQGIEFYNNTFRSFWQDFMTGPI